MDTSRFARRASWTEAAATVDLVRFGLVAGSVLLAGFGFAALVTIAEPDGRSRATGSGSQLASARLPRPRPAEPVITGSIKREVAPQSGLSRSAGRRDDGAERRLDQFRSAAMLAAAASSDCDEVVATEVLQTRGRAAAPVVIWVECRNGARFYLDRQRLESELAAPPSSPGARLITDMEAVRACEDKVRLGLPVPSSLRRRSASTAVDHGPGRDPVVTFDVDALNGLGFPLPLSVRCAFQGGRIARLAVDPR